MKLEFLGEGSQDCPVIRLYDFDSQEAQRLLQIALQLAGQRDLAIALHAETIITPIDACELTLRCADGRAGVRELSPMRFEWVSSDGGWLDIASLIQPFCHVGGAGHQWLSRVGNIAVLLSLDGTS